MRPIIAILIAIFLFAGTYAYTSFVESIRPEPLVIQEDFSAAEYAVRITRSFDCQGDPDFEVDSLLVKFRSEEVLKRTDVVPQGELIELRPLKDVVQGRNEIYVTANVAPTSVNGDDGNGDDGWGGDGWGDDGLADDGWGGDGWDDGDAKQPNAKQQKVENNKTTKMPGLIRIQVWRGRNVIQDQTIWQESGSSEVSGSISFRASDQDDGHDH